MLGVMDFRSNGHFQHENIFHDKKWKSAGLFLEKHPSKWEFGVMLVMKESNTPNVQYSQNFTQYY